MARFKLGEGIVGWAAKQRKIVSVSDATKDSRFKNLEMGYSPRSVLIMPLESPRRLVGALTIARKEVKPFTSVEQALMQIIANQAAISIDNARLYTTQKRQIKEIADRTRELEIANAHIAEISRLKSEFLANMSHELRTPLNAILGFSEILKDNLVELSEDQRHECLENIHASGKHLLELVNDVLDLSKIEAGRMELAYDRFTVGNAVREVHNVIRSLSERRDIDLAITVEPDGPRDPGRQEQVQADPLQPPLQRHQVHRPGRAGSGCRPAPRTAGWWSTSATPGWASPRSTTSGSSTSSTSSTPRPPARSRAPVSVSR